MSEPYEYEPDDEPTIELLDGQVVSRAVYETVQGLRAQGYVIAVENGEVRVTPTVHENAFHVLDSNWGDTQAVLEALNATEARDTTILRTARETVH